MIHILIWMDWIIVITNILLLTVEDWKYLKIVEKIRICVEIVEHNDEIIEYGLLNFEKLYELDKVKELFYQEKNIKQNMN